MSDGLRPLQGTVLDRLLDPVPERERSRKESLARLRAAVRRDLEALLNTRRRCLDWPADAAELDSSLLAYGVPEFTGTGLAAREAQEAYCRMLERTIRRLEPRLLQVEVRRTESADPLDPTLRFRISALMHAEPAPEPLVLDSALDPATQSLAVRSRDD
ncbi:type VI secretion system baseplate subunit TssE [Arenibaculum pallidiluteum]|uniref:type VI secretion system baseplate subunit TssE n=1 Tax=Arenibaculum pallidiluteum TaxID=2812559 RepID=UPI001A95A32A|nr:type VI secretion system baseplate subunit TssE [Arenibaculum pallidiluteum]